MSNLKFEKALLKMRDFKYFGMYCIKSRVTQFPGDINIFNCIISKRGILLYVSGLGCSLNCSNFIKNTFKAHAAFVNDL